MGTSELTFRREAIQELMAREHLTASEFARRAAMSRTLVAAWLSGLVMPQVGTLTRLCRVYDVQIDFFFTTDGPDGDKPSSRRKQG